MGMRRRNAVTLVLAGALAMLGARSVAGERSLTAGEAEVLSRAKTVYVEVETHTWMYRGHNLEDVSPIVRNRLTAAGFTVVRDKGQPHDLSFVGQYREERGEEIQFDVYTTKITLDLSLRHASLGEVLTLTIRASTLYPESGTPPYLDALHQFDANPYYFLIGDIVKQRVRAGTDVAGGLIAGLERLAAFEPKALETIGGGHSMASNDVLFAAEARDHAMEVLGRLKDARAIPVLLTLVKHRNPRVRSRALTALGQMGAVEARPAIEEAAKDENAEVREAASAALATVAAATAAP